MNNCCFSGRLTKDAETKTAASGMEISTFTLAVDCGYGEKKRTEFIFCKRFKPGGFAQYLTKGRALIVSAEYEESKWEKDGQKHSRPSWIVRDMEFGQGTKDAGGHSGTQHQTQQAAPYNATEQMDDCPF